jgi:hypothetical protein
MAERDAASAADRRRATGRPAAHDDDGFEGTPDPRASSWASSPVFASIISRLARGG